MNCDCHIESFTISVSSQRVRMKCKYRMRWFSSKGAFLVLLWILLLTIALNLIVTTVKLRRDTLVHSALYFLGPIILAFVSAPLSGWLADANLGNYKVFRFGVVLSFISAVMNCLILILKSMVCESNYVLEGIRLCAIWSLFAVGCCACIVTALPLGLDQMPDASSSSITSFIAWLVFTTFIGSLVFEFINLVNKFHLIGEKDLSLICALFSTLCLSVILIFTFVFSPKWLIIEPKSPQSLKTIYQVLKFAAKHKAPLNRSAFTYWEEDIPSRIDLGKSKYGGPFTTEQVEDVKTVLRLLVISSPLSFVLVLSGFHTYEPHVHDTVVYTFVRKIFNRSAVYIILTTLVVEFLIYPLTNNIFPSILKRIAAAPLLFTFVSFACFILKLTTYLTDSDEYTTNCVMWIIYIFHYSINSILYQMLFTSLLELMCAQSPYHMRGLLVSFTLPLILLSYIVNFVVSDILTNILCHAIQWCPLLSYSVKTLTCFIAFLLFCFVARWYKMRVRDEDYSPQRVVEEVYDRYLTAAAAQSTSYGTINT